MSGSRVGVGIGSKSWVLQVRSIFLSGAQCSVACRHLNVLPGQWPMTTSMFSVAQRMGPLPGLFSSWVVLFFFFFLFCLTDLVAGCCIRTVRICSCCQMERYRSVAGEVDVNAKVR